MCCSGCRLTCKHGQDENPGYEQKLTDLNADIEEKKSQWDGFLGKSDVSQSASESKTVQQTEGEGYQPRCPCRETGMALFLVHDLDGKKQNGKRDHGFHGRRRHVHKTQRGQRERDAVGDSERGDCHQQLATPFDDHE